MINNVVLVGRLANDPEMRYTPSGMPIANFRLAVDRGRKSESGEEQTDWLDIVAFQKTAELVAQYLDKGSLVGVEGRIQSRSWEGQDGKRNWRVEIIANNVRFLESRAEAERRRAARGQSGPPGAGGPPRQGAPQSQPGGSYGQQAAPPPMPTDDFGPVGENEDPFGDQ
jgi:single-strand DNA-binding protein